MVLSKIYNKIVDVIMKIITIAFAIWVIVTIFNITEHFLISNGRGVSQFIAPK